MQGCDFVATKATLDGVTCIDTTVMPFNFTFSIPNPFASSSESHNLSVSEETYNHDRMPSLNSNRKRGWEPSFQSSQLIESTNINTRGYLDTPAKYRDAIPEHSSSEHNDLLHQLADGKSSYSSFVRLSIAFSFGSLLNPLQLVTSLPSHTNYFLGRFGSSTLLY